MVEERSVDERLRELEARLDALAGDLEAATNRDIPLLKGTIRSMMDAEIDSAEELPDAGKVFGQRARERAERLDQLEARLELRAAHTDQSTKAEKIATVLRFARNKANGDGKVAVTPAEIRGCTGVSRRYAYDLSHAAHVPPLQFLLISIRGSTLPRPCWVWPACWASSSGGWTATDQDFRKLLPHASHPGSPHNAHPPPIPHSAMTNARPSSASRAVDNGAWPVRN